MKILITSGGTKVPIDRVRDISNMSSGTFGSRIATAALRYGHDVVFMKAKNSKTPFTLQADVHSESTTQRLLENLLNFHQTHYKQYNQYEYRNYDQYAEMLKFVIGVEQPNVIVLAAAVSDYGVENYHNGKLRSNDHLHIQLKQLPKLINRVKEWAPQAKLIGFKLLVDSKPMDLLAAAQRSLIENHCDMVVANDLQDILDNNHQVHLVFPDRITHYKTDPNDPDYLAKTVVANIEGLCKS